MKKLISIIYFICSIQPAFAEAKLHINVAGTATTNTYFLCVNQHGCVSMYAAAHGRNFPVDAGQIKQIFLVNAKNLQMSHQTMPASCNIAVNENQTLTITGKIAQHSDGHTQISKLNCRVS